jgi:opacity protein-like surface antigen
MRHFYCEDVFGCARKILLTVLMVALFAISVSVAALAQTNAAPDPKAVPVMDGGIGPCSADIAITDANGAPVYAAKVKVHIAYGWMNTHKLDLEAGTNIDGKLRFTGLPDRIKHGIYFRASEGNRTGEAFDDPANTCKAQFGITIRESDAPKPADAK